MKTPSNLRLPLICLLVFIAQLTIAQAPYYPGVSGGGHFGGGMFINSQDHARFGLLFLRDGRWNNQQLISKEWVEAV